MHKIRHLGWALLLVCVAPFGHASADPVSDCVEHIPWGAPSVTNNAKTDLVCHAGYLSALDQRAKVPLWVAYGLTGPHTLGCLSRAGLQFKVDDGAPAGHQGKLKDYSHSGYQLGHMAPNQDFAWSERQQRDSFSFVNVAPQLGSLNAQGWERGEEYVRAWALARGEVQIYVGSVVRRTDKKLGASAVDIPKFFYKVVIDPNTGEGFGIIMAQKRIKKQPLAPFTHPILYIEQMAHLRLPLPANFKLVAAPSDASLKAWRKAKKAKCT